MRWMLTLYEAWPLETRGFPWSTHSSNNTNTTNLLFVDSRDSKTLIFLQRMNIKNLIAPVDQVQLKDPVEPVDPVEQVNPVEPVGPMVK